jgi:hypothetical protein
MYSTIKAEHEDVDPKFLSINMQSILKKLHKTSLVHGHHMVSLSKGVEIIELMLNELL